MKQLISITIVLLLCSQQSHGQQAGLLLKIPGKDQIGGEITASSVGIYNHSSGKRTFLLGGSNKVDTITLSAKESWYSKSYAKAPTFSMYTEDKVVIYNLKLGSCYMIDESDKGDYWDLKKIICRN